MASCPSVLFLLFLTQSHDEKEEERRGERKEERRVERVSGREKVGESGKEGRKVTTIKDSLQNVSDFGIHPLKHI